MYPGGGYPHILCARCSPVVVFVAVYLRWPRLPRASSFVSMLIFFRSGEFGPTLSSYDLPTTPPTAARPLSVNHSRQAQVCSESAVGYPVSCVILS